jgi:hypothetical protein
MKKSSITKKHAHGDGVKPAAKEYHQSKSTIVQDAHKIRRRLVTAATRASSLKKLHIIRQYANGDNAVNAERENLQAKFTIVQTSRHQSSPCVLAGNAGKGSRLIELRNISKNASLRSASGARFHYH